MNRVTEVLEAILYAFDHQPPFNMEGGGGIVVEYKNVQYVVANGKDLRPRTVTELLLKQEMKR